MSTVRAERSAPTVIAPHRRWRWPLPAWPLRRLRALLGGIGWVLRGLRGVAVFVVVRGWPHLVVRPWQSHAWPKRWHAITDEAVQPWVQTTAIGWTLLWGAMAWYFGESWCLTPVVVVIPQLALGIGRLVYPHTTRGAARGRFHPDGFATWPELRRSVSAHAVRVHAVKTRPAIARKVTPPGASGPSAWRTARLPAHEAGTYVGTTAIGPAFGVRCYARLDRGIGIVGPPQTVKTMLMTDQVADWAGRRPFVSLQTKASTYHDTAALCAMRGVRVHLIDPEGLTGDGSTFRWAPWSGCADPATAARRAAALVTAAVKLGKDDGPLLKSQASDLLRAFLLLAAVTGRDMHAVYDWSQGPANAARALKLMRSEQYKAAIPTGWDKAVAGVLDSGATRTTGAVFYALREAVAFMGDPAAAELCTPGPDDAPFDVAAFLDGREGVYLIATDREENRVGPLLSAFAAYVTEEAMRIGGPRVWDRGRLEPFLGVSGDEAANTIPLDLPRLMSDSGGRGIQVCWSAQSRSQLEERFGEAGAQTVWNATACKLQGSGSTVEEDLRGLSDLSGTRMRFQYRGATRPEPEPVLAPHEVRRIPERHAVLVVGDMLLTIVRVRRPWTRPDVIAAKLRGRPAPSRLPMIVDEPKDAPCAS